MTQKNLFPGENQSQAITVQEDPAQVDFQSIFSDTLISPAVIQEKIEYFKKQMAVGVKKNQVIQGLIVKISCLINSINAIVIDKSEKETETIKLIKELRNLKDQVELPGKSFLNKLHRYASSLEGEILQPLIEAEKTANEKLETWRESERIRIKKKNADKIADADAKAEAKKQELTAKLNEALEAGDQKKVKKISSQIDNIEPGLISLEKELPAVKVLEILDDYKFLALLAMKYCFQMTPEEKAFLLTQEIGPGVYFTPEDIERFEFMMGFLQNFRIPGNFPNLSTACIEIDTNVLMKSLEKLPTGYYAWGNQVDEKDERKLLNETWGQIIEKTKKAIVRR